MYSNRMGGLSKSVFVDCTRTSKKDEQSPSKNFHIFLEPTVTVTEMKEKLADHLKVPPSELRLETRTAAPTAKLFHSQDHLLFGSLASQVSLRQLDVVVRRQVQDPLLTSLFNHVRYEDWKEMDEVTHKMTAERKPNHCFCGNIREEFFEPNTDDFGRLECTKCHHRFGSIAWQDRFPDRGYAPARAMRCPYTALQNTALKVASHLADLPCHFRRPSCIHTNSPFASNLWRIDVTRNADSTKIVHDDARLQIVFRPVTLNLLEKESDRTNLQQFETDKMCPRGANIGCISSWKWSFLRSKWYPALKAAGCLQEPNLSEFRMKLKSYDIRKVVYEVYMGEHSDWDDAE